jgi:hypothetical protein
MPRLSNGKITTSAIFYNRGVPPNAKNFGTYVAVNYEMVRQVARFLKSTGVRPNYTFL